MAVRARAPALATMGIAPLLLVDVVPAGVLALLVDVPLAGLVLPAAGLVLPAEGLMLPAEGLVLPAEGLVLPAEGLVLALKELLLPLEEPLMVPELTGCPAALQPEVNSAIQEACEIKVCNKVIWERTIEDGLCARGSHSGTDCTVQARCETANDGVCAKTCNISAASGLNILVPRKGLKPA